MFSKISAVCFIAVLVANVTASIRPGIYRIQNVASYSLVRAYNEQSPIFVSSTREYPGPFALFEIQNAEGSSGYTIKNIGLDKYVSGKELEPIGEPLYANGVAQPFSIEQAGMGEFVVKAVNYDLVWTVDEPVIPRGNVVFVPERGLPTQRFIFIPSEPDLVHQPSSAKFRAKELGLENIFQKVKVILEYLPYGGQ